MSYKGKIIGIPGSNKRQAFLGDIVSIAIQEASPSASVRPGDVAKGLIVRVKKEFRRDDGTYMRFGENAVVVMDIDARGEIKPKGKRVSGPLPRELREKYKTVTNISDEVV